MSDHEQRSLRRRAVDISQIILYHGARTSGVPAARGMGILLRPVQLWSERRGLLAPPVDIPMHMPSFRRPGLGTAMHSRPTTSPTPSHRLSTDRSMFAL